jgi:hypothetical protein
MLTTFYFGKPERKETLGKHRRKWEDNIRWFVWLRIGPSGGLL